MELQQTDTNYPEPVEGDYIIHDFRFEHGETLPELKLHYRTIGEPIRDERNVVRNAVLILHGTGGTGERFLKDQFAGVLFGAGQLLSAEQYYLILPDNIGHGQSTKPSDGLRANFPQYGYRDMIRAQYRLLTEQLGVNHLRLVMGTSMGGMHTWLWGEQHPDFMDALMPLASLPIAITGRNRMMRRMMIDSIRNDPNWKGGEYEAQPPGLISAIYTLMFMVSSPLQLQKQAPTKDKADQLFDEMVQEYSTQLDANNLLYHISSSADYNPEPELEKIKAPLLAINFADDQVNPPELGILEKEIKRVKSGRHLLIPTSDQTCGHVTHSLPEIWQEHLARFLEETAH